MMHATILGPTLLNLLPAALPSVPTAYSDRAASPAKGLCSHDRILAQGQHSRRACIQGVAETGNLHQLAL